MLTLEEINPYLPYGLKVVYQIENEIENCIGYIKDELITDNDNCTLDYIKPVLFPLSCFEDINSEYMNNLGVDLSDQIIIQNLALKTIELWSVCYSAIKIMNENKIDYQNLIPKGKAINVLEIDKNIYR